MRRILYGDKEFVRYLNQKFGIDYLGWNVNKKTLYGLPLDLHYFFDGEEDIWKHSIKDVPGMPLKVVDE